MKNRLTGVGARLLELRSDEHLTQREVADRCQLSWRTYQAYELEVREISAAALSALDEHMGWNPSWILRGAGEPRLNSGAGRLARADLTPILDMAAEELRRIEKALLARKSNISAEKKSDLFKLLLTSSISGTAFSDAQLYAMLNLAE